MWQTFLAQLLCNSSPLCFSMKFFKAWYCMTFHFLLHVPQHAFFHHFSTFVLLASYWTSKNFALKWRCNIWRLRFAFFINVVYETGLLELTWYYLHKVNCVLLKHKFWNWKVHWLKDARSQCEERNNSFKTCWNSVGREHHTEKGLH